MSGCVTVSGPPRSNWRWNSGTTEPVLPSTLPKRTVMQRMPRPVARAAMSSAWQYISASRFDAPITEVGFTALSVEISTIARAPTPRAASATWRVPATLVSRPSSGLASTIGTCFSAAAWNTSSGRHCSNTARTRASSRMSASSDSRGTCGWRLGQFQVDQPQRVFAVVEQDQPLGTEGGDLARQFAADRAAGAGDDDPPALDQPRHALAVERHLRAGSAGPRSPSAAVRAGASGPPARRDPARSGAAHGGSACRASRPVRPGRRATGRRGRRGHHQRVRQPALAAEAFQHRGGILDRAEERVAVDAPPGLARADRQQTLDLQRLPPIPGQRAQEQVDVLGRADHQRRRNVGRVAAGSGPPAPMAPAAIDDPRRAEQHQQGQRIHDGKGRVAGRRAGQREHEGEQGGAERAGPGHRQQVVDPGETPVLPRQPERQPRQQQGRRTGSREPPRMQPIARRSRRQPARAAPPTPPRLRRWRCSGRFARAGALPCGPYNAADRGRSYPGRDRARRDASRLPIAFRHRLARYSRPRGQAAAVGHVPRQLETTRTAEASCGRRGSVHHATETAV